MLELDFSPVAFDMNVEPPPQAIKPHANTIQVNLRDNINLALVREVILEHSDHQV